MNPLSVLIPAQWEMLKRLADGDSVVVRAGDFRYQDGTPIEDTELVWNLHERGLLTVSNADPHRFVLTDGGRAVATKRTADAAGERVAR